MIPDRILFGLIILIIQVGSREKVNI